jgi:hypothetical protein
MLLLPTTHVKIQSMFSALFLAALRSRTDLFSFACFAAPA